MIPALVPAIERKGDSAKVMVSYASARHCELAFDSVSGEAKRDKQNRKS